MLENLIDISKEHLLFLVLRLKYEKYRLVSITCVKEKNNGLSLSYHFDKDYEIISYRINIFDNQKMPSIAKVFVKAEYNEQEINRLYGITFEDINDI